MLVVLTGPRARSAQALIAVCVLLTALIPSALATPARADGAPGPHSPVGRALAPTKITRVAETVVRSVDLGDVELARPAGRYRAPVRGLLITPAAKKATHSPLVVIAHLRFPGCAGNRTAYPCPSGKKERRFDRGMRYLGVSLARRGYSVLIPDPAPVYVGDSLQDPYDQPAGVRKVLDRLITSATARTT